MGSITNFIFIQPKLWVFHCTTTDSRANINDSTAYVTSLLSYDRPKIRLTIEHTLKFFWIKCRMFLRWSGGLRSIICLEERTKLPTISINHDCRIYWRTLIFFTAEQILVLPWEQSKRTGCIHNTCERNYVRWNFDTRGTLTTYKLT